MRAAPNLRVKDFRRPDPGNGQMYLDNNGWFLIPYHGIHLRVIASDGEDWDHVSVSLAHRCPTWEELEFVRELFFRDDETVMQLSVPRSDHLSFHPFCLHLWRPQSAAIPRPPASMVAPPSVSI